MSTRRAQPKSVKAAQAAIAAATSVSGDRKPGAGARKPRVAELPPTTPITVYRRPRRMGRTQRESAFFHGRHGKCFQYAWGEAMAYIEAGSPSPAMHVVHGTVGNGIGHAWIERGGFAYDWQTFALDEGQPLPIAAFYAAKEARVAHVYEADEVRVMSLRYRHFGPWDEIGRRVTP